MTNDTLQKLIGNWFPNPEYGKVTESTEPKENTKSLEEEPKDENQINSSLLEFTQEESQFLNVLVNAENLYELMTKLKENGETNFDYLFCLSGVDWGAELGVVYHLESTKHRHNIVVKVKTQDRENPNFNSVYNIWRTAEFHEREVYDFFGIKFNKHPNLKHLFLTDQWSGFPLRKDYVDEVNMIIK